MGTFQMDIGFPPPARSHVFWHQDCEDLSRVIYKVCNRPEARPTRSTHVCYYARYMILDTAYACTEFRGSQFSFVDNALGKPQISHFAFFKIYATAEIDLVFCPGPEHELWSSAGSGPHTWCSLVLLSDCRVAMLATLSASSWNHCWSWPTSGPTDRTWICSTTLPW